jgi:hypothetical protein
LLNQLAHICELRGHIHALRVHALLFLDTAAELRVTNARIAELVDKAALQNTAPTWRDSIQAGIEGAAARLPLIPGQFLLKLDKRRFDRVCREPLAERQLPCPAVSLFEDLRST